MPSTPPTILATLLVIATTSLACGADSSTSADPTDRPSANQCSLSITVRGDVEITANDVPYNIGLVDKNGQPFVSLMANQIAGQDHPFVFWMGLPRSTGTGEHPFYSLGLSLISLQLVGGNDYAPLKTNQLGKDPGSLTITKMSDNWVEAEGRALLHSGDGDRVEVEVQLVAALPPARCK